MVAYVFQHSLVSILGIRGDSTFYSWLQRPLLLDYIVNSVKMLTENDCSASLKYKYLKV